MKLHLAKQLPNDKQVTVINECGRRDGVNGNIRIYKMARFAEAVANEPENCCKQCLAKYEAKKATAL